MNVYRVRVVTHVEEVFEIDAESEDQAAQEWFDGALVSSTGGDADVTEVTLIDKAESGNRWVADRAAGRIA